MNSTQSTTVDQKGLTASPAGSFGTEGTTIGPYKLLEKIGEGGFGEVWLAEQREPVKRRVALKIIKLGMDTRQVVARFEAERQALALMDHPNIAKVFDGGATENGRPYFVMELVKGVPITEFCETNKLPLDARLKLFIQICQAIQHAHQKGIIHRDIKPSNILVSLQDGTPVPKVIDFGIAKATQQQLTDKTIYTQVQQFIGTPAYMSPEQAELTSVDIDTRSDIYSLGVLLYELLTGSTPFDSRELLSAGLDEMRRIIREKDPPRPSTVYRARNPSPNRARNRPGLTTYHSSLSTDLDWIVMKCLEKDRARRYETANGLALDIQRHLASEPVAARPPTNLYRLQKLARRNRAPFAAGLVTAVALLAAAVLSSTMLLRERKSRRTAELAQIAERKQKEQAVAAREHARSLSYTSDMNVAWRALNERDFARVRALLSAQIPLAGEPDLRGWEWRYLWKESRGDQLFTLPRESSEVYGLAFLSGNRLLAAYNRRENPGLAIWDVERRELVRRNKEPEKSPGISGLALSSDRQQVAVCRWSYQIELLDSGSLQDLRQLSCSNMVWKPSYSPNGEFLAALGSEYVTILHVATGKELWSIKSLVGAGWSGVCFSPDNTWVAIQTRDESISLFNPANGALLRTLGHYTGAASPLVLSPDGHTLAFGDGLGNVHFVDVVSGQDSYLTNRAGAVVSIAFSPDAGQLAGGNVDGSIQIWDIRSQEEIAFLQGHQNTVGSLLYSDDGTRLFSGANDGTVRAWSSKGSSFTERSPISTNRTNCGLSRDGSSVAAMDDATGIVRVIHLTSGVEVVTQVANEYRQLFPVALRPDGRELAAGRKDGTLEFVDTTTGKLTRSISAHTNELDIVEYSRDGKRLATAARGAEVRLWEVGRTEPLFTRSVARPGYGYTVWGITFFQDGSRLLVLSDMAIDLIDTTGRKSNDARWDVSDQVWCADVSPDGRMIAAGSSGSVSFIDVASHRVLAKLAGAFGSFNAVRFSPDGQRLAAADSERLNWFWDVSSHREVGRFRGAEGVARIAWTPDGDTVVIERAQVCHVLQAPAWTEIRLATDNPL